VSEVGRNAPCPCGSGRKYKKCCLGKDPGAPYTRADRESALVKLVDFSMVAEFAGERLAAGAAFWSPWLDARGEGGRSAMDLEASVGAFSTWFALDVPLVSGATVLQLMLRRQGASLGRGEREYLDRMRDTHLRPYQITDVKLDEGLRLIDLWSGEHVWVQERLGTSQLVRWDLIVVRLMRGVAGELVIDGRPYLYPVGSKEVLLRALRRNHRDAKRRTPFGTLADSDFFRRATPIFHHLWLETVVLRPLPKLLTAEGDPLVFARAIFDVRDRKALLTVLDSHPDIDREDDGNYGWFEDTPDFRRGLGRFVLEKNRLVLETQSKERVERSRALLESLAGDAVRFRLVEYEDPERAMERVARLPRPEAEAGRVPPEVEARVIGEFYEQHYRGWLDELIPALGNRTPRHAARLKSVRPKLVALLQEFENMAARQLLAGRPAYDFGWMWAELRLPRPG
jgi:hypothetical protein